MMSKDFEQKWSEAIVKAKGMVTVKVKNQMMIAEVALSVCEISWGGGHMAGKYTLTRFAGEVGICSKTLSHWCAVRRNVYESLPKKDLDRLSFTKISHISAIAGPKAEKKDLEAAYEKVVHTDSYDSKMRRRIFELRTVSYNFTQQNAAMKCNKDTLQEILFYTTSINREILAQYPDLKPKSHGIASMRIMGSTIAKAVAGARKKSSVVSTDNGEVTISPKDRDVAQWLEKHGKFAGPTEIGKKAGKQSENAAAAWALRSLVKLVEAQIVERDPRGNYRFIE